MSRPPQNHDAHNQSLNNALTPFGVIDFVDNHCLQAAAGAAAPLHAAAAPHPGVVGGPPAYLDAHGIRYVPAASLEAGAAEELAAPQPLKSDAQVVSRYDLESRVDDRIRQFMRARAEPGRVGARKGYDVDDDRYLASGDLDLDAEEDFEMRELRKLRAEVEAASARSRASAKLSQQASAKLSQQAPAKLSQPAATRVSRARRDLDRGTIDF